MASESKTAPANGQSVADRLRADWPHLLRVGGLVILVLGVLILGAILEDDSPVDRSAQAPATEPAARPEPGGVLARRAAEDGRRLGGAGGGYTLQLAAVCDPRNAERWIEQAGSRPDLHLLAARINDRDCYRVCWGHYASARLASEATPLPRDVRALASEPPRVTPVAQVLP